MSQEVTKSNGFKPTPAMTVWLDTAVKNVSDNVSEISKECNVSRQSWYRWVRDDDFIDWFRESWEKALSLLSWKLDVIGLQKASEDFRFWEAMQKRVGNLSMNGKSNPGKIELAFKSKEPTGSIVYLPRRLDESVMEGDKE